MQVHNSEAGDPGVHHMFRRSISHQDMIGRTVTSSEMGSAPPDLEQPMTVTHARSIDNIAVVDTNKYINAPDVEIVGPSSIYQGQVPSHMSVNNANGRVRMPFPPIPKLESVSAAPMSHPTPVSMSHVPYSGVSGFGTITPTVTSVSGAGGYPVLPHTPVYVGQEGDQGWRLPQYKKRPTEHPNVVPLQQGGYINHGPGWTRTEMGPPPPPQHHGHHQQMYQAPHPPAHNQPIWNNRENRYVNVMDDCGSGMSRESSREDLNSECEQQFDYEQRFRVDRKKLEIMMTNSPEFGEAAAEFFERIGVETDTCVIWPSRLKIGAKSKKDPHIRVGGRTEEGVMRAKMMISEVLDTSTNSRVTMKMDVSYTDHSHIIGKGGNTIRRVMAETNCHIHFPDSNRSNPNEKSNQVSIAGEMSGVERARARVRELTPLLFNFDLPIVPSFQQAPDTNSPFLRAIQDQYNIQIMFRQKQKNFHTTTVVVKGCEWECSRVKEATLLLMDNLCTGLATSVPVVMLMEVSPQHHATVLGKGNINLKIVMQRTNTVIIFPDAGDPNIPPIKKGSVSISGAIHNVYLE